MFTKVTLCDWVTLMCKRIDWIQAQMFCIVCLVFLYSYTYWWTTGVLKHLPLPFDEGRNYICSLPYRVPQNRSFSQKSSLTVLDPKSGKKKKFP